jgi:serine/threonine-protein kinase
VLLALYGALRVIVRRVPDSLIQLPDKAYWLAPERRAATLERFVVQAAYLIGLAILLLDAQLYLALEAARAEPPVLSTGAIWGTIVLFTAASLGWLAASMRAFRRPKAE